MSCDILERDPVWLRRDVEEAVYSAEIPDTADQSPSVYVPCVVAAATERDLHSLPPLYACIDPDALDALFADRPTGHRRESGEVTFSYGGVTVTVTADGVVRVRLLKSGDGDRSDG